MNFLSRLPLSLVTYTFNDHDFVAGLLTYIRCFKPPPVEIIIVDDASNQPYSPPASLPWKTTILRAKENMGPGQTKRLGLSAASGEVIFSLDADIRPHAKWLAHSLALLEDESVGLVGSACAPNRTASALGAALYRTARPRPTVVEAAFIPGSCMLFRKKAWDRIGGLDDFTDRAFEDYHLSKKFASYTYRLLQNNTYPVYDTRHLHRTAYCRRQTHYFHTSIAAVVERHGVERYLADCMPELTTGLEYYASNGDPILIYFFLLKFVYLFNMMATHNCNTACFLPLGKGALHAVIETIGNRNKLLHFLEQDLAQLGIPITDRCASDPLSRFFSAFDLHNVLDALEHTWIDTYALEDQSHRFDNHYLLPSASV